MSPNIQELEEELSALREMNEQLQDELECERRIFSFLLLPPSSEATIEPVLHQ